MLEPAETCRGKEMKEAWNHNVILSQMNEIGLF